MATPPQPNVSFIDEFQQLKDAQKSATSEKLDDFSRRNVWFAENQLHQVLTDLYTKTAKALQVREWLILKAQEEELPEHHIESIKQQHSSLENIHRSINNCLKNHPIDIASGKRLTTPTEQPICVSPQGIANTAYNLSSSTASKPPTFIASAPNVSRSEVRPLKSPVVSLKRQAETPIVIAHLTPKKAKTEAKKDNKVGQSKQHTSWAVLLRVLIEYDLCRLQPTTHSDDYPCSP
ncbi:hypothetical protein TruAng_011550 [Truncatella angustata]|nr:hypothetical protein TruAng_011550 [Truncatella angustata]